MPDERPVAIANTSPLQYLEEEPRIVVTPSGLEMAPGSATVSDDPPSPTENPAAESATPIHARRVCSKCSKAAHLAALAANAVRNADLSRAIELLVEIQVHCCTANARPSAPSRATR